MHCHCCQSQILRHAFHRPAIFTEPAHRKSPLIYALGHTSDTINQISGTFQTLIFFQQRENVKKALHVSYHLFLLPSPPLRKMPLCIGRRIHRIRRTVPFPSFPSHLCPTSRSTTDSEPTAHRHRQSLTTHCIKQYLSIARRIPILFATFHPQISKKALLPSRSKLETHKSTTCYELSTQSAPTASSSWVPSGIQITVRTYCGAKKKTSWPKTDFSSALRKNTFDPYRTCVSLQAGR